MKKLPNMLQMEKDPIWKEACDVCEYIYTLLDSMPEDEKWETTRKLRSSSNDLMFSVAQAVGNCSPSGIEFDWSIARKHASSLKTIYRFAGRQKFITLDPQIMVRLDNAIKEISKRAQESFAQSENHYKDELERWLKRQKIRNEVSK